ncbi:3-oxoacyl-[acyl-carrier-protein] synthase-1 [Pseudomonas sp. LAMO17WK12:I10]|uniref:3-oxoacyl-ACP synthase n=1 Tax=unclassified Pseudomonas TaxID=196821 RepID=UPI000BC94F75|nr:MULTISPECIES: 3-oxoacyl-ACP synthase [unclassified Pseudomonas]PXX58253.1 3-oxoacyl-[acyl-carrier-protein] synthase-1 [Pseudomonas sp. LAMO17WK12:I9]SNY47673.1 3-oxoacyl-[acyl-carrier-protein] synthase-1 [Pseudomonas sp. LAMO17WK12:I10]
MASSLNVSCLGLVSAVGLTPESTCAAMRAGLIGFEETPFKDDSAEPIIGAMVPIVDAGVRGKERVAELMIHALACLPERLPSDVFCSDAPLLLCTREAGRPGAELQGVVAQVESRLGFSFCREGARHFPSGAVAAFESLAYARSLLDEGVTKACLVVAVDTLIDVRTLHWLDNARRLKRDGNSDGIVPGEAACVALVTAQPVSPSFIGVQGLGFATETATVFNDDPLLGQGMAQAIRGALREADVEMHEISFRLSDVSGEAYAFEEIALAQSRLLTRTRESQDVLHPAGYVGDCGAANGLLQVAWAEQAMVRRYACGPLALAHATAPFGARAAAVLKGEHDGT